MTEYLLDAKSLYDQLAIAGSMMTEGELIEFILDGLGHEYKEFTTSLHLRSSFTFDEFYDLLIQEEHLIKRMSSLSISTGTALVADRTSNNQQNHSNPRPYTDNNNRHNRGKGRGRGRDWNSGCDNSYRNGDRNWTSSNRQGKWAQSSNNNHRGFSEHPSSDNRPPLLPTPSPQQHHQFLVICQQCNKPGHTSRVCPERGNFAYVAEANESTSSVSGPVSKNWVVDSGATHHMTSDPSLLSHVQPYTGNDSIIVGNGNQLPISHIGKTTLSCSHGSLVLHDVLYVPAITKNLLSIRRFSRDNNCYFEMDYNGFRVKDNKTGKILLIGSSHGDLYYIRADPQVRSKLVFYGERTTQDVWHTRLGHPSSDILRVLVNKYHLPISGTMAFNKSCHICPLGKACRLPFSYRTSNTQNPLELLHLDIWGPSPMLSNYGYKFYLSIVDDYSRFVWLFPLARKSDVMSTFITFKKMAENRFTKTIKMLQTNGGGEFTSRVFVNFLRDNGISQQVSCPYTPQQNGTVERKHRHIVEMGLCLLAQSHLPSNFWVEAFTTAVFLINRLPMTHLELKSKVSPSGQSLQSIPLEFSILSQQRNIPDKPSPLNDVTPAADFGNPSVHTSNLREPIQQERDQAPLLPMPAHTDGPIDSIQPSDSVSHIPDPLSSPLISRANSPDATPISPSTPQSSPMPPKFRSLDELNRLIHGPPSHPLPQGLTASLKDPLSLEPSSYTQASKFPHWQEAMTEEYDALMRNQTWSLVPISPNMNIVGCKWVFRVKRKADGTIERHKARLVAKGYNQKEGFDYYETFSPVVKPATIRTILALAVSQNWILQQLDVRNAFLNGILQEEVYMVQPPGFVDPLHPKHVCRLHKALYGLKQAPRAWFQRLTSFLLGQGFLHSKSDASLFIHHSSTFSIYVLVYVDDLIVTGQNASVINTFIDKLCSTFASRKLGALHFFLGMEVTRCANQLSLSQARYASDLLKKFKMDLCKPCPTPLLSSQRLSAHDGDSLSDPETYRSMVGGLQYLTLSRPDIAYAVNQVCQYMHNPKTTHLQAVKRIYRYIKGTIEHGLIYRSSPDYTLRAFSDADWAGSLDDRRSTSGACIFLGPNILTWTAKKQSTVSRSSSEAEYRALATTVAELQWFRYLFRELGVPLRTPPCVFVDNISALHMAANPVFHARTRHIEIDYHFVRELLARGVLRTRHVSSQHQLADIFTKSLSRERFSFLSGKLNLHLVPFRLRGGEENDNQAKNPTISSQPPITT
ncbi:unnamed protein product [Prunus armeniaca]